MSTLSINVARLAEGDHHYTFAAKASDVGLGPEFSDSINLEVDLERRGRQFLLEASFTAATRCTCDRCLDEFNRSLTGSYSMLYVPEGTFDGGREEEEEFQVIPADTQVIHLDDDVRQYVLLSVPTKLLCKEECLGICPVCGKNRNLVVCSCSDVVPDARWDALKKLSKN